MRWRSTGAQGNQRLWDLAERVYPTGVEAVPPGRGPPDPRRAPPQGPRHRPREGHGAARRADPRRRSPASPPSSRASTASGGSIPRTSVPVIGRSRDSAVAPPCSRRSTRSCATGSGWRTCSSSTTSSRCTSRQRSAAGATSRCRCSTATGWSASSMPRPIARPAGSSSTPSTRTCPSPRAMTRAVDAEIALLADRLGLDAHPLTGPRRSSAPAQRRRSQRSWLATTTVPGVVARASSSSPARASERWFVGSSRSRRSGSAATATARPSRAPLTHREQRDRGARARSGGQQSETPQRGALRPLGPDQRVVRRAGAAAGLVEAHVLHQLGDPTGRAATTEPGVGASRPDSTPSRVDLPGAVGSRDQQVLPRGDVQPVEPEPPDDLEVAYLDDPTGAAGTGQVRRQPQRGARLAHLLPLGALEPALGVLAAPRERPVDPAALEAVEVLVVVPRRPVVRDRGRAESRAGPEPGELLLLGDIRLLPAPSSSRPGAPRTPSSRRRTVARRRRRCRARPGRGRTGRCTRRRAGPGRGWPAPRRRAGRAGTPRAGRWRSSSRWLVGSSSSRQAGRVVITVASASRVRCPPDERADATREVEGTEPEALGRLGGATVGVPGVVGDGEVERRGVRRLAGLVGQVGREPLDVGDHPCAGATAHGPARPRRRPRRGRAAPGRASPGRRAPPPAPDTTRARGQRARQRTQQGGLAGAVLADEAGATARGDGQVETVAAPVGCRTRPRDRQTWTEGRASAVEVDMREPFDREGRTRRAVPRARVGSAEDPHDASRLPAATAILSTDFHRHRAAGQAPTPPDVVAARAGGRLRARAETGGAHTRRGAPVVRRRRGRARRARVGRIDATRPRPDR